MFLTRLRKSEGLRLVLEKAFPDVFDDLWWRVENGRALHTVYWRDVLREISKSWAGGRILDCPYLNPFKKGDEEVDWVDATERRPHVRLRRNGTPGSPMDSERLVRHQWVQLQLLYMGLDLGEEATFSEFPLQPDRADVVWMQSKIAWEVDFSPPPPGEQLARAEARANHKFDMVALVDHRDRRKAFRGVPTLIAKDLRKIAKSATADEVPSKNAETEFRRMYVQNVWALGEVEQRWKTLSGVRFQPFCSQYLQERWRYEGPDLPLWSTFRGGWIRTLDFTKAAAIAASTKTPPISGRLTEPPPAAPVVIQQLAPRASAHLRPDSAATSIVPSADHRPAQAAPPLEIYPTQSSVNRSYPDKIKPSEMPPLARVRTLWPAIGTTVVCAVVGIALGFLLLRLKGGAPTSPTNDVAPAITPERAPLKSPLRIKPRKPRPRVAH